MEYQNTNQNITNKYYIIIGIITLIITTIGATFAYYTATESKENTLTGNMATVELDLTVAKVTDADDAKGGLIPMSNNMIEKALTSRNGICIDNNGNAVCQVYKIIVLNSSTASIFVDGYVTLSGGSGTPDDIGPNGKQLYTAEQLAGKTTMRWAQAFCTGETAGKVTSCTTAGKTTVRASTPVSFTALGGDGTKENGFNIEEILAIRSEITQTASINGNDYEIIDTNYIRISTPHTVGTTSYTRTADTTSALVYSQYLDAQDNNTSNNNGDSNDSNLTTTGVNDAYKDAQVYYIAVWLSENGHNQTIGSGGTNVPNQTTNFFQGSVTFNSAQGSEVTAAFTGYTAVTPDTKTQ